MTFGGVKSRLMVTLAELVPPPLVASQVRVVPEVLLVIRVASQPVVLLTVDSASLTDQLTSTGLMYQPLSPNTPLTLGVMTGGVVSLGAGLFCVTMVTVHGEDDTAKSVLINHDN